MSLPPQFPLGVPQPPKQAPSLQFKKPRKYFGDEGKPDMKKSSIFFSNPSQQQAPAPAPINNQQGSIRLEFKKKNVVLGAANNQQHAEPTEQKPLGFQPAASGGKPMMYSSLIIKPTTDLKSFGLEGMGKYVGGQDLNNRFGADKPLQYEGFGKPAPFFENKKPTEAGSLFTTGGYTEERKTNTFDAKYGEVGGSGSQGTSSYPKPSYSGVQPQSKLSYTPNFTPEYSASLPSYGAGSYDSKAVSSAKSNEFPVFAALMQQQQQRTDTTLGISNASTSSSTSSYKDDRYYLDLGRNKADQIYGGSAPLPSSYSSPIPSYSTDYSSSLPSSSSYQPSFSKKPTLPQSRPQQRKPTAPINQIQLSCKAKKSDFHIGKKLGKGQFGDVFVVKHKATGFICAMKIITKKTIKQEKVQEQLVRELKIQFYLHNKNIVALYGFFCDTESVYLLLELCCEGQLFDIIKKERRLPEDRTSDIVRQVCLGIEAIHRQKIIHRDIKPENIILHEGVAKICDFGWAVYRGDGLRTTFCGTPMYTSPQMLRGEKYDEKIDIWAIGILTYELLIGRIPFRIMCQDDLQRILTDQITFPDYVDVTSTAKDFILKVLKRNQHEQYDIEDIINHPFLKEKKKPEEFAMINL